jgi:hypothetical protein
MAGRSEWTETPGGGDSGCELDGDGGIGEWWVEE